MSPRQSPNLQITTSRFSGFVRGVGTFWVLGKLACPRMYDYQPADGGEACWSVPIQYVADVVAMAELLNGLALVDGDVFCVDAGGLEQANLW